MDEKQSKHYGYYLNNFEVTAQNSNKHILRTKLNEILDFKPQFEEVFRDFQSERMVKDALYYKLKESDSTRKALAIVNKERILPEMYASNREKLEKEASKFRVKRELQNSSMRMGLNLLPVK